MAKILLSPITGAYASVTAINARLQLIEDTFNNNVLWRDGFVGEPNVMDNDLDMGDFNILNYSTLELSNQVGYAEEWAQKAENIAVSVAAGGGVGEFSALHYSAKAAIQAGLATTNGAAQVSLAADQVALAAAQVALANADVVLTHDDVALTGLDVDATNADVITVNGVKTAIQSQIYLARAVETNLDDNGNASTAGDIYFNTALGLNRTFNGTSWQNIGTGETSAAAVSATDAGNRFEGTNLEAITQEIGTKLAAIPPTLTSEKQLTNNTSVFTLVEFDTPSEDSASGWDTSFKKYIIPTAGLYAIDTSVYFQAPSDGATIGSLMLYVNGVTKLKSFLPARGSIAPLGNLGISSIVRLSALDEVKVYAGSDSWTIGLSTGVYGARLSIVRVGN